MTTPATVPDQERVPQIRTDVEVAGLRVRNPVWAAAGCVGTGREWVRPDDLAAFGAVVTRSITATPRAGLATPRLAETPSGVINAVGFPGPGVEDFVAVELPWLVEHDIPVVASIVADTAAEYGRIAQLLRQVPGILAIEVNLSNPVTQPGRQAFSMNAAAAAGVVHVVRRNTATSMPVFAKLSGDTTDIVDVAQSCVHAGAAALSLINAVRAVGIDTRRNRPALATPIGGLSGPAIKPIALRAVWEVHAQMPDVPIIASGGVATATDALEMLLAGASAVAIGSALLSDPAAGHRIAAGLQELLVQRDTTAAEVRGAAHAASASRTTPGQEW